MAMISAPSRNSWAIKTLVQRCATRTCCNAAARGGGVRSTHDAEDWPQAALRPLPVAVFALCPRRFSFLEGLQHARCGRGEEAQEHAEDIAAETALLLRRGPQAAHR